MAFEFYKRQLTEYTVFYHMDDWGTTPATVKAIDIQDAIKKVLEPIQKKYKDKEIFVVRVIQVRSHPGASMLTKDEYQDLLDESYPTYTIMGYTFHAGKIIRECDPVWFDVLYNDYIQMQETTDE